MTSYCGNGGPLYIKTTLEKEGVTFAAAKVENPIHWTKVEFF